MPLGYEFEDWGTQFSSNPICIGGNPCSGTGSDTKMNITPGVTVQVDRKTTLSGTTIGSDPGSLGYSAAAMTKAAGSGCVTDATEGCLLFSTGDLTKASLTLDWYFHSDINEMPNVGIKVTNLSSDHAFDVAVFYFDVDTSSWKFGESYTVPTSSGPKTYFFDIGATTDEVIAVYNPLVDQALDGYASLNHGSIIGGPSISDDSTFQLRFESEGVGF